MQDQDRFFWFATSLVLRPTVSGHITGLWMWVRSRQRCWRSHLMWMFCQGSRCSHTDISTSGFCLIDLFFTCTKVVFSFSQSVS